MGSGIEILRRQQLVKAELSGGNFAANGAPYILGDDVAPYVPSSAAFPPGDAFSPKAQEETTPQTDFIIQKGQDNSQYLPVTTGANSIVTFENGRPNVSISLPTESYTDIANNIIQAIIKGERPQLPPNIRNFISVVPPRDSSADRGAAANIASPLSNATPNTTTTTTERTQIRLNGF